MQKILSLTTVICVAAVLSGMATMLGYKAYVAPISERTAVLRAVACVDWDESVQELTLAHWGAAKNIDYGFSYDDAKMFTLGPRGQCSSRIMRTVALRSTMLQPTMPFAAFDFRQSHYVMVLFFTGPDGSRTYIAARDTGETGVATKSKVNYALS